MLKQYYSKYHVSLSVKMESGSFMRISFNQVTGGGSVYYTENEAVQKALEAHPKYGKLYRMKDITPNPIGIKIDMGENAFELKTESTEKKGVKKVPVASLPDAKDYLANVVGISRSKLRSEAQIRSQAAANNIEFEGI